MVPRRHRQGTLGVELSARGVGRRCASLVFAALLVVACGAERDDAPLAGYNLVVVNVDALRADHLGFHGYARPTSPFLDGLAARGVVFERAISSSSYTRESVASLLTGRLPSSGGSAGWDAAPAADSTHLGEQLRAAGYRTGFFSNTLMLQSPGFTRGFEEVQHLPARWDLSGEGLRLSARALRFAGQGGDRPFAMYLHYLDPHAPYDPAPEQLARLAHADLPPRLDLYREIAPHLAELREDGFGPGDPRFEAMVLRYDAEILGTDAAIGALVRGLAELGVADRTLLVVTSDHGEEFLEHGGVEHGWTLFQESIHVPLLFVVPEALAPMRVSTRVSQVDLLPTLQFLLGLPAGALPLDGQPLFELDAGSLRPGGAERTLVAEILIPFRNVARATLRGDWKLVSAWRWLPPEQRSAAGGAVGASLRLDLGSAPVSLALYDLEADAGEHRERSPAPPAVAASLREALAGLPSTVALSPAGPATLAPEERERLRALGYAPE